MHVRDMWEEDLWIYTEVGVFRFCARSRWEHLFVRIVRTGWEMSSQGDVGWLHSELNPYPQGSFFTSRDAKSFAAALKDCVSAGTQDFTDAELKKLAELFSLGPVLIRAKPPRKTAFGDLREVAYGYSCAVCGFIYHGSWLFSTAELSMEEIRSSVETMLKSTYCPLCGAEEIISVPLFLQPFDPDHVSDFTTWEDRTA